MPDALHVMPVDALERLSGVLATYAARRRITADRALYRQGLNLSIKLAQEFMHATPPPANISLSARARGWALGREAPGDGSPGNTGLSAQAIKRARAVMGSYPSILARIYHNDGRVKVTPVALGKMNRRTGLRKRVNYRPGKTAVVSGRQDQAFTRKGPDDRTLNFRALATIYEMNVRESGRRFLAVSWMHRRWRTLASKDRVGAPGQRETRKLENINPRSALGVFGEVVLETGSPSERARDSLRLTSFVPGVAEIGKSRGIFARAMDAVSEDMTDYLRREESARLAREIARGIRS